MPGISSEGQVYRFAVAPQYPVREFRTDENPAGIFRELFKEGKIKIGDTVAVEKVPLTIIPTIQKGDVYFMVIERNGEVFLGLYDSTGFYEPEKVLKRKTYWGYASPPKECFKGPLRMYGIFSGTE
jgi:hypothetical protein